jgi:localization factor PodJL
MHNLGVIAAEGSEGKPNYTGAALWFGKAAGYGLRDSQYHLAVLLARGLGVSKDLVRSYTWFAIVAAAGDEEAARKRNDVATRLTSSELATAKAAAAAFVPSTPDREANEPASPPLSADTAKAAPPPATANLSGLLD